MLVITLCIWSPSDSSTCAQGQKEKLVTHKPVATKTKRLNDGLKSDKGTKGQGNPPLVSLLLPNILLHMSSTKHLT